MRKSETKKKDNNYDLAGTRTPKKGSTKISEKERNLELGRTVSEHSFRDAYDVGGDRPLVHEFHTSASAGPYLLVSGRVGVKVTPGLVARVDDGLC